MIGKLKAFPKFLGEVKEELKKANWATREELIGTSLVVIVVSAFLTIYIYIIDFSLAGLVNFLFK